MGIHLPGDYLGEADVLARLKVGSVWNPWKALGICTEFSITADSEQKDNMDHRLNKTGQISGSATIAKPAKMKATLTQLSMLAFQALCFGTVEEIANTEGSSSVSSGAIYAGDAIRIPYMDVSDIKATAGSTGGGSTMGANIDYTVNTVGGYIEMLNDFTDGVLVSFDYPDSTGYAVNAYTNTLFKMGFELRGKSLNDGRRLICEIWEVNVTPKSPFNPLGTDYVKIDLEGNLITPSDKTGPYKISYFD